MKKLSGLFFTGILILLFSGMYAQTNRREGKKTIPYKSNYQRMASGSSASHTLEIKEGLIHAWGDNTYGQLGDGTTVNRVSAVIIGSDTKWVSIATGGSHSLGLKSDGTLWSWGLNSSGQLGDGTTTNRITPVQIGTDSKWISVAAGNTYSTGLKSDGTLWAWGDNAAGQLGDGTYIGKTAPVQIGTDNKWVAITSGHSYVLSLKSNGTLWGWGDNANGQLGDGTLVQKNAPVQIGTDNRWATVSAGFHHSLAIRADGSLFAWGDNSTGQLGDGTLINQVAPVQIGTGNKWVKVVTGNAHSMGLKSDGTLWTWGGNAFGELGDGTYTAGLNPAQIGTEKKWVAIVAGNGYSVGLRSNGTMHAWGHNNSGQLGDGTNTDRNAPVQVTTNFKEWVHVSAGAYHTFTLKSNGLLYAWGDNGYGRLGEGTIGGYRLTPFQIGSDDKWVCLLAGGSSSLAIKSDGTLWSWGYNYNGQVGDGTTFDRSSPVQIGTDDKWVSIALGSSHALALKSDGTLWAWGANYYGAVGDGSTIDRHSPVQVGTDNKWVSVTAGINHSFGLKSDGTLWAWGDNQYGALGDGSNTVRHNPVQIGVDNKWVRIASNLYHTLALKSDGTLWTWGNNSNGQLGSGGTVNRNSPGQVGTDNSWISVSAGLLHSTALKSNGVLMQWGYNLDGQLGDGTTVQKTFPVQIGTDNTWVNAAAGRAFTFGIKSERAIYCATGDNQFGQIGDNTLTDRTIFTCNTSACFPPSMPASSNVSICGNNTATLSAGGSGILGWYSASTGGAYLGGGVNFTTPVLTSTTTYYVQDSTCSASATRRAVTVNVIPGPAVTAMADNSNVCAGNAVTLTGGGAAGYTWSGGVTNGVSFIPSVSDTYTVTATDSTGCSGSATISITVNALPLVTGSASSLTVCSGNSVTLTGGGAANYVWTGGVTDGLSFSPVATDTYTVTGTDINGCSDTASVVVAVSSDPLPNVTANAASATVCPGTPATLTGGGAVSYVWTGGIADGVGFIPSSTGTYTVTGTDINNCSNTASITVTVLPVSSYSQSPALCAGENITVGLSIYSVSGTYFDTLAAANGCDSIVTTILTVESPVDVNTSLSGITITANQNGAGYQWLDCSNGNTPVAGATTQSYTAAANGDYSVVVMLNGCADTSACVNITSVGIAEQYNGFSLNVYPNPANGTFVIHSSHEGSYVIANELGQTIQSFTLNSGNSYTLNIDGLSNGIYFVTGVNVEGEMQRQKFVVLK